MSWADKTKNNALSRFATREEQDEEAHWQEFINGDIPDCKCDLCDAWKANAWAKKHDW